MKQVLLESSSAKNIMAQSKKAKQDTRFSKSIIIITPSGQFSFPVLFEADEGDGIKHRDSIDPDDMTNEAFWNWLRQRN